MRYCRAIWDNTGSITIKKSYHLSVGAKIVNRGTLTMGQDFMINGDSIIICSKRIEFGDGCLISWGLQIMDTDFHSIYDCCGQVTNQNKEIVIGDNCWIGSKCNILKGTRLPSNTIVALGSTITKQFTEEHCVICNNQVIKKEVNWRK